MGKPFDLSITFKRGRTVLDLGCGDGILSEQIAQLVPNGKVVGLDASRGMLETAKNFQDFTWPWCMPSRSQYQALMKPIGFSEIEIAEEKKDRYFSDADELIGWINQPCIVPFLKELPDERKEAFRQDVIQTMIERTRQPDGTCFETFRRLNITARK